MNGRINLVVIEPDPAKAELIAGSIAQAELLASVQTVSSLRMALARVEGGNVQCILFGFDDITASGDRLLTQFRQLKAGAGSTPVFILSETRHAAAEQALREGAAAITTYRDCAEEVRNILAAKNLVVDERRGRVVSFVGATGGVGATTAALGVAVKLTKSHNVLLAELHEGNGSLAGYLKPERNARTLAQIANPTSVATIAWRARDIRGLAAVFAPAPGSPWTRLESDRAATIARSAAETTGTAIVDLPAGGSAANIAVAAESDTLAVVVKRDPLSVDAAHQLIQQLSDASALPRHTGVVIVNQTALPAPMPLHEIEGRLGLPLFGVIPPAADLCYRASMQHTPAVLVDPESAFTRSIADLANAIEKTL